MTRPLRAALVGAGLAARSHALDIVTDDAMELAGIVAATPQSAVAMTRLFGGEVYQSLDAMLDDRSVTGVVVAVPPRAAFEVLKRVTETCRPCLAEKPVATSKDDLPLLEHLTRSNAPVIAPFNRRYQRHLRQAHDMLAAGEIGEVVGVDAVWRGPYRERFGTDGGTYRASAGCREGVLLDSGAHALDAISLLLGGVTGARADSAALSCNFRGAEVAGAVSFAVERVSVALRLIDVPGAPACGGWRIEVFGTDGGVTVDDRGCAIKDPHGTLRLVAPAAEMARPVSDLHRLSQGNEALGTGLDEVTALSDLTIAIYDAALARRTSWLRPRGKALGRLNGAC